MKMHGGQRSVAHDLNMNVNDWRHRISKTTRHCTKIEALAIIQTNAKTYRQPPRYIEQKKRNHPHGIKASIHTELKQCEEIKWNEKNTTFYQPTLCRCARVSCILRKSIQVRFFYSLSQAKTNSHWNSLASTSVFVSYFRVGYFAQQK